MLITEFSNALLSSDKSGLSGYNSTKLGNQHSVTSQPPDSVTG